MVSQIQQQIQEQAGRLDIVEQRGLLHEQQFSSIQTSLDKLDARLDKMETDLSMVTLPVKLLRVVLKSVFKVEV